MSKQSPRRIEVRMSTADNPTRLSHPIETYGFDKNTVVYLDLERNTWFMYYNEWRAIRMKLAPVGTPDTSPPSAPPGLEAAPLGHNGIRLTWDAATDPDTGVLKYTVYRDGMKVGDTRGLSWAEHGLKELTSYHYHVTAVNLHGTEGPSSDAATTTSADITSPRIVRVRTGGSPREVLVVFDEPLDEEAAVATGKYSISPVISVLDAELQPDRKSVLLTTSPHSFSREYMLSVSEMGDRAASSNVGDSSAVYTCAPTTGLVGYWRLDEGSGDMAHDTSGLGNHGELEKDSSWTKGIRDSGLRFDGIDDYVHIPSTASLAAASLGSITVSAWVKPLDIPANTDNTNQAYCFFRSPNLHVGYRHDQRFVVRLQTSDASYEFDSETVYPPGQWQHLAVVRDDENDRVYLYIDGVLVQGFPASFSGTPYNIAQAWGKEYEGTTFARHHGAFRIGVSDPGIKYESWFANAIVDEVQLHDRALTAAEIRILASLSGAGK